MGMVSEEEIGEESQRDFGCWAMGDGKKGSDYVLGSIDVPEVGGRGTERWGGQALRLDRYREAFR